MKEFAGIVTGGTSGMGEAVVEKLLGQGAEVVAVDRNPVALLRLKTRIATSRLYALEADVTLESAAKTLVDTCHKEFGELRFLVNCAGITGTPTPFEHTSPADFDAVGNVNLRGTFLTMREARSSIYLPRPASGLSPKRPPTPHLNGGWWAFRLLWHSKPPQKESE